MGFSSPEGSTGDYGYGCNRPLTSISSLLGGGTLVGYKMNNFMLLFIFQWLIHVSTLSDLDVKCGIFGPLK
jgi:hypothetical protein